uniref:Uncharacterized protein n=1 Tax=Ciona intestinalis TaxID=7719 RepID=H2XSP8_CIOIN
TNPCSYTRHLAISKLTLIFVPTKFYNLAHITILFIFALKCVHYFICHSNISTLTFQFNRFQFYVSLF